MFTPGVGDPRRYDEMTGTNGSLLPGWSELVAELDAIGGSGLSGLTGRVDRLLEDDGVTYTPVGGVAGEPDAAPAAPERWRLDPLPLVVEDAEWTRLEAGLIQRSTLLDAMLDRPVRPEQADRERAAAAGTGLPAPRLPAAGARHHHPRRAPAVLPRRRRLPGGDRRIPGAGRSHPGAVRRRLRDGGPAGGVQGAAGPVPAQRPARARCRSSTPCARRWRRWRRTRPRTRGSWCSPRARIRRPRSTRPCWRRCWACRWWRAPT